MYPVALSCHQITHPLRLVRSLHGGRVSVSEYLFMVSQTFLPQNHEVWDIVSRSLPSSFFAVSDMYRLITQSQKWNVMRYIEYFFFCFLAADKQFHDTSFQQPLCTVALSNNGTYVIFFKPFYTQNTWEVCVGVIRSSKHTHDHILFLVALD